MLLYRVIPYRVDARPGSLGHPLCLTVRQGEGRLDNPAHYTVAYFALEPSGAVGETFADVPDWTAEMFRSAGAGSVWALATYMLANRVSLLELDSASNLVDRGLRPTQVIERNRSASQAWARKIYRERNDFGERLWDGVRWWSYHRPGWRIVGYWGSELPAVLKIEALGLEHPAVVDAAYELGRMFDRPAPSPRPVDGAGLGERSA
ncbi:RES domain-containing protein [Cryptosporangium aurantiacum]|uniref:RES domain-containing protein n=1 Tax=Cryptosporangium aurantiacum TaxID=134849 RepID=A0A1M7JNT9_9ACTN|nr:RES domain-containing protein [Cryptosporangium aurantiacum]SHM54646.1 RES domain-containing protein [Cryptosporangium aurantiacum]